VNLLIVFSGYIQAVGFKIIALLCKIGIYYFGFTSVAYDLMVVIRFNVCCKLNLRKTNGFTFVNVSETVYTFQDKKCLVNFIFSVDCKY
jgi:hypothetical protein